MRAGPTDRLDCDDLDPLIHPDADETWENGITDNDCDGEMEDVEVEYGAEALVGEVAGANAGRRLDAAGDIDGDGVEELAVSAQLTTVDEFTNAGLVGIFPVDMLGNPSMADAPIQIRGTYTDAFIGGQLQRAGDQDGDGLSSRPA